MTAIVIPHDSNERPHSEELAGPLEFQAATGGWLEPIKLEAVNASIYMSGDGQRARGNFNARATALHWIYGHGTARRLLLGDAVLVAPVRRPDGTLPGFLNGLSADHEFVVQLSPDEVAWYNTPLRFPTVFDAALWAVLIDGVLADGISIRIGALAASDDVMGMPGVSW